MAPLLGCYVLVAVQSPQGQKDPIREADRAQMPYGCNPIERETVLYRMPEVARGRHQALEERWEKGIWLGHARSTNATLVATDSGVIKVWGGQKAGRGAAMGWRSN